MHSRFNQLICFLPGLVRPYYTCPANARLIVIAKQKWQFQDSPVARWVQSAAPALVSPGPTGLDPRAGSVCSAAQLKSC